MIGRRRHGGLAALTMVLAAAAPLGCVPPPDASQSAPLPPPARPADHGPIAAGPMGVQRELDDGIRVRAVTCSGLSIGSSFAVAATTLVTNRHVVAGAQQLQLDTATGRSVRVRVAGTAFLQDLAIVRTAQPVSPVLSLATADPRVGLPVTAVGFPLGGAITATHGRVLGYQRDPLGDNAGRVIVTDAFATHGNSGGPLLSDGGAVVGVVYAADGRGHSLAIPVTALRRILARPGSLGPVPACGHG